MSTSLTEKEYRPPKLTIVDYLLFPLFLLVFISVLVLFDPILKIAGNYGLGAIERIAAKLNLGVVTSLRVLGTKFDISGTPPLQRDKTYIIVSNHQSMFDISTLYTIFTKNYPRFIAKKELSRGIPSVSYVLRNDGSAIIDRKNPAQAIPQIRTIAELAKKHKFSIVIFPEGTRARNGKMKEFKSRGVTTLLEAIPDSEIIPVAIDGSWKLQAYPRGPIPHGITIHVHIGKPIAHSSTTEKAKIVEESEKAVRAMLEEIRKVSK